MGGTEQDLGRTILRVQCWNEQASRNLSFGIALALLTTSVSFSILIEALGKRRLEEEEGNWRSSLCSPCRRLHEELIAATQYLKRAHKKNKDFLHRTKNNYVKLIESRFGLDRRTKFFTVRVVRHRHRLSKEDVDSPSLEMFKVRLDRTLSNKSDQGQDVCVYSRDWVTFKGPVQLKIFYDSVI